MAFDQGFDLGAQSHQFAAGLGPLFRRQRLGPCLHDVGVLSGDSGYLMSMEFHRTLASGIGGYLFHDYGSVRTRDLPRESAHSVGAGLEAQWGSIRGNMVAGYALNRVQPDQRHWRVTGELSYAF